MPVAPRYAFLLCSEFNRFARRIATTSFQGRARVLWDVRRAVQAFLPLSEVPIPGARGFGHMRFADAAGEATGPGRRWSAAVGSLLCAYGHTAGRPGEPLDLYVKGFTLLGVDANACVSRVPEPGLILVSAWGRRIITEGGAIVVTRPFVSQVPMDVFTARGTVDRQNAIESALLVMVRSASVNQHSAAGAGDRVFEPDIR